MKIRLFALIAAVAYLVAPAARCQTDSIVHVNQFPGLTVGDKVSNAMNHCPDSPVQCYLVLDASLAAAATGNMPSLPSNAQIVDFRSSWPGGYTNNVQFVGQCSNAHTDMGACINAAIQALPAAPIGGEIDVPTQAAGCWHVSTQIVLDRPVLIRGQSYGFFGAGTCLEWHGGAEPMFEIDPAGNAASSSIIENFSFTNATNGTAAVDIGNAQYNVTLQHIAIDSPGSDNRFSRAGIVIGGEGATPTIDTTLRDVRVANQTIGLDIEFANTAICMACHIYDNNVENVKIGDPAGPLAFDIKFIGSTVEQDATNAPSFLIGDAISVELTNNYAETNAVGQSYISIESGAPHANNIIWNGGYIDFNSQSNSVLLDTSADANSSGDIENVWLDDSAGTCSGCAVIKNPAYTVPSGWSLKNINGDGSVSSISTTSSAYIDVNNVLGVSARMIPSGATYCWENNAGSGQDCLSKDTADNLKWPNNIVAGSLIQGAFGKTGTYTVAGLPAASGVGAGVFAIVTDASTATVGTCTGGGSTVMLAVSDGTTWTCH